MDPAGRFLYATNQFGGDPSGRFAYVANLGSNNVSAFTIDERSGRLSPVSGSPFAAGTFPSAIAVDVLGKFVYVTNEIVQ